MTAATDLHTLSLPALRELRVVLCPCGCGEFKRVGPRTESLWLRGHKRRKVSIITRVLVDGEECGQVELTHGKVALVSVPDIPIIQGLAWLFHAGYAKTSRRGGRSGKGLIRMHRLIMQPSSDQMIDHINGNGLDNRRANLRVCSMAENHRNRHARGGHSRFKGVSRGYGGMWVVSISVDGRTVHAPGRWDSEEDAAREHDRLAREYHGEFANLNFPDE